MPTLADRDNVQAVLCRHPADGRHREKYRHDKRCRQYREGSQHVPQSQSISTQTRRIAQTRLIGSADSMGTAWQSVLIFLTPPVYRCTAVSPLKQTGHSRKHLFSCIPPTAAPIASGVEIDRSIYISMLHQRFTNRPASCQNRTQTEN